MHCAKSHKWHGKFCALDITQHKVVEGKKNRVMWGRSAKCIKA
jgi:hypothetical protein